MEKNTKRIVVHCLALLFIPLLHGGGWAFGQPETEVYLASLTRENGDIRVSEPVNISQNPGYDNQPSFTREGDLLYSRTREGQTDIALYAPGTGETTWRCDTPEGGEYSPMEIPGKASLSAVRLDTTGLQRLYEYPANGGGWTPLHPDLKVGYYLWLDEGRIACTVLVEGRMDLVLLEVRHQNAAVVDRNVGRSLLRVPGTNRFSYTRMEGGRLVACSMDPAGQRPERITALPEGVQDLGWLPDGRLLCGNGNQLLYFTPGTGENWEPFHTFPPSVGRLSRLALNREGTRIAFAAQPEPAGE